MPHRQWRERNTSKVFCNSAVAKSTYMLHRASPTNHCYTTSTQTHKQFNVKPNHTTRIKQN